MQRTRRLGGVSLGNPHEVAQGRSSRVGAAVARAGGARLFSRPVLLVELRADVGDLSAVKPETPPLLLPRLLVAQGSRSWFTSSRISTYWGAASPWRREWRYSRSHSSRRMRLQMMARLGFSGLAIGLGCRCACGCWCGRCKWSLMMALLDGPEWNAGIGYLSGGRTLFTCLCGGLATGRCGGHASKQAGKALRSRGHPQRTKRSGILAILNKTKVCITKQQESQNNSG